MTDIKEQQTDKKLQKKLREYAIKIGLCVSCKRHKAIKEHTNCQKCADFAKAYQKRRRQTPGNCYRCGSKIKETDKRRCLNCQKDHAYWNKQRFYH